MKKIFFILFILLSLFGLYQVPYYLNQQIIDQEEQVVLRLNKALSLDSSYEELTFKWFSLNEIIIDPALQQKALKPLQRLMDFAAAS